MSNWLTKSAQTLAPGSPPEPEPFQLACACGQTYEGERRERFQQVICRECGEALFVLPVDVYPQSELKAPKKSWKKKKSKRKSRSKTADAAAEPAGPPLSERLKESAQAVGRKSADAMSETARRTATRARRIFTPFRLVVLAMLGVAAGTGYWAVQAAAREDAEATLRTAMDEGYKNLREGLYHTAAQDFQSACDALDVLGRDDELAREVRQMQREALALSKQADLFELIEDAESHLRDRPSVWRERFQTYFRGQWVPLVATVTAGPGPGGVSCEVFGLPFDVDGHPCELEGTPDLLAEIPASEEARLVVFAAELAGCRYDRSEAGRWLISINPETAFLWCDMQNFRALGFVFDEYFPEDEVRRVLDEQSRLVGFQRD